MNGFTTGNSIWPRDLHLGVLPEQAAARNSSTLLTLDHDLDALPGAGRRLTSAELAYHADDLAGRLAAAGVRAGEYVAIYKGANFDVWLLAVAAARVGAVPVMLSPALDGATVGALLARLDRPHLLADAGKLGELAGVPLEELTRLVITTGEPAPGAVQLAALAGSPRVRPVLRGPHEPAMVTHTSGTTGVPKLVVHTARTMGTRLRPQWWLLSLMRKRETVAVSIPFVHSRLYAAMALVLLKAMPVLLMNDSGPKETAELFARHRPGFIEALPGAFLDWEGLADDPREPFASVKYFSSTFDAIHPRTINRLLASSRRRSAMFFQIYGQSEVGPAVGRPYFRNSTRSTQGRCVGFPMPGCARVRVVSRDGRPPSRKNPGFIEVRWEGIAKTYHGEGDRFAANLDDGWWRTGDVGYRTRRGCLHMLDREADMIPRMRSSLEIEDLLLGSLDELAELVVVSGDGGEPVPVVCTVDDRPLDPARWRSATADFPHLAAPVQLRQSDLPRTATMKVRRNDLARIVQQRRSGSPGPADPHPDPHPADAHPGPADPHPADAPAGAADARPAAETGGSAGPAEPTRTAEPTGPRPPDQPTASGASPEVNDPKGPVL